MKKIRNILLTLSVLSLAVSLASCGQNSARNTEQIDVSVTETEELKEEITEELQTESADAAEEKDEETAEFEVTSEDLHDGVWDSCDLDKIPNEEVITESNYLKTELIKHKPVNPFELLSLVPVQDYSDKILFYNGDLASMFIDALAIPAAINMGEDKHKQHCVYYYNGINLLKKLHVFTKDKPINKGEVVITRSYNVPCDFILHVNYDYKDIATSIINILECSRVNMVKSILIDIDMNDLDMYKTVYDTVCKYLDKYKELFDKIIIYVNPAVEVTKLEKELS